MSFKQGHTTSSQLDRGGLTTMVLIRGGSRVFSRGDSLKKFENFVSAFFRPTKFSFQSVPEYSIFGHFMESFDKKSCVFFWRAFPLKFSLCWRQRRLSKKCWVGRPKKDFLKSTKRGTFGSAGGRNPEERAFVRFFY